jgi:hypothetical protein
LAPEFTICAVVGWSVFSKYIEESNPTTYEFTITTLAL